MKKLTKIQVELFKKFVDLFELDIVYQGKNITFEESMIVLQGEIPNPKTIDERRKDFISTLAPHVEEYGKEMINSFYKYWAKIENNKLKFEEHGNSWTLNLRLAKWKSNSDNRLRDNYIKEVSKRF
jgi:hypothetical protein